MSGLVVLVDLIPNPAWLRVSIRGAGEMDGTHLGWHCGVGDRGGAR
jgi:hypothetical protein